MIFLDSYDGITRIRFKGYNLRMLNLANTPIEAAKVVKYTCFAK